MTLMVRDEADIIIPMIEYHLHAGVDVMIITDNGSVDGTREILARYESDPRVTVLDEPTQDGDQSRVVTGMARLAATEFDATWVINADADEFFVPRDRNRSLGDVFREMPVSIASATIPVVDMTGTPARSGPGLARLVYRDERAEETLYDTAGLHAHATHDAIHVGSSDVVVSHGNHFVSIASRGAVPDELMIESLHFPWRSFAQFSKKVHNAGVAYASNPGISPSPRHHGMRDFRFRRAGVLQEVYLYRHPAGAAEQPDGLRADTWLADHLRTLLSEPTTILPDELAAALDDRGDQPYSDDQVRDAAHVARAVLLLEEERAAADSLARETERRAEAEVRDAIDRASALEQANAALSAQLERIRRHPLYRAARLPIRALRGAGHAFGRLRSRRRTR